MNSKSSSPQMASPLFERTPDAEYIKQWTESLQQPPSVEQDSNLLSVLIFRLGKEWFALPTILFKEIAHRRPVHSIPHRRNKIFQGLVNLNGELKLYVALHELLEIDTTLSFFSSRLPYQNNRMVAIARGKELWVFPVDEIEGIDQWNLLKIENVPMTISKSAAPYIKGIMNIENKKVGLLDEELLFASLNRSLK
jgi:chemotaxis-related protein WspD